MKFKVKTKELDMIRKLLLTGVKIDSIYYHIVKVKLLNLFDFNYDVCKNEI